jgi:hypothetical protein
MLAWTATLAYRVRQNPVHEIELTISRHSVS